MSAKKIQLVCVVGPTASGKTALGIAIAKNHNGEVISADSMQIYKGIHIASAAPDAEECCGIPHHLIEFLQPGTVFSVAEYVKAADAVIADISDRGKLPVIVGGTGLYINSLIDHIQFVEEETDPVLRQRLTEQFEQIGGEAMLRRLQGFDPDTAARLHSNDKRRIIRAFEVYEATGKTFTEVNAASRPEESPYDPILIGLTFRDRQKLYDRINLRVDRMLENGLIAEAKTTISRNTAAGAGQAIGHKELYPYLCGEMPLSKAAENLKQATRRYAKRQLTWFCRNDRIHWIYADETPDVVAAAENMLTECRREELR